MSISESLRKRYYSSKKWKNRRKNQLKNEPFCAQCLSGLGHKLGGGFVAAVVADHIKHDWKNFHEFLSWPLQSLCWQCHYGKADKEDRIADSNWKIIQVGEHSP